MSTKPWNLIAGQIVYRLKEMKHNTKIYQIIFLLLLILSLTSSVMAQFRPTSDTSIIFTPSNPNLIRPQSYRPLTSSWGLDILFSNNGFGAGTFYRHEFSDEYSWMISFAISDVKDETEFEQYDYYTGQNYVPGKKNRLLMMPLIASVQYRLFKDDIVDNFRPFVTAGLGPMIIFVAPYASYTTYQDTVSNTIYSVQNQIDFFSSLKYGTFRYSIGGYIGAGAYFGMEKGTLTGLNVRYLFSSFPGGIEVMQGGYMKNFGGLFITLTFGSLF